MIQATEKLKTSLPKGMIIDDTGNQIFFDADTVIEAMQRLVKLIQDQTKLIKLRKLEAIEPLTTESMDLSQYVANQQNTLQKNKKVIKRFLTAEKKELLKRLSSDLVEAVEDNHREAQKAMYANQEVIKIISKVVEGSNNEFSNYKADGTVKGNKQMSITVNDEV